MKFIVSSSYLLKQLQVLGNVINSSNTLPILDNFLFELNHSLLTVSASDLETTMSATIDSMPWYRHPSNLSIWYLPIRHLAKKAA